MLSVIAPLMDPLLVRGLELGNRIVMAPMTRSFSPGGVPGADVASYYARRAAGGVGLIITEGIGVAHAAAIDDASAPLLHGDGPILGWRRVVEAVHNAGGLIVSQLWHQGVMRDDENSPRPEVRRISPSGLWGPEGGVVSLDADVLARLRQPAAEMTDSDVADVVAAYAESARNAVAAGFDGIAIHAGHGYLIDTFLWRETNRRNDTWGGDPRRRAAFASAVVRAIRREIGEARPIFFRFSQWKMQDYRGSLAVNPDELEALLGPIADAGVDVFDGSQRYFDTPVFPGSTLNLAGWAKKLTGRLAMTVGGIGLDGGRRAHHVDTGAGASDNLPLLAARFSRGEFDLAAVGRSLLNDPLWLEKAKRGEPFVPFDIANLSRLT